ncbi:MAG: hypothetical protein RIQ78_1492 [Bacteroidota bacterium]
MILKHAFLLLPMLFCTCRKASPVLFELLDPAHSGIDFVNKLSEGDSLNILNYVYYYNGGGVGIADFNNDGLEDVFFTGNETSCKLYLNKGNLHFEDITRQAGITTTQWCTGVALADVNADGWMDLYVCTAGYPQPEYRKNLLFINHGNQPNLRFSEEAAAFGIADTAYSTQAAFFDYDHDGDLDLYVMNHANERQSLNTPLPKKINGESSSTDHLYRNNGDLSFTNVSQSMGIQTEGYGLGLAIADINNDGWEDVYVSNDFIYNDLLYINNAGKNFSNQITRYIRHQSYNGMGCDIADFNNDGRSDLVVTDMLPETDENRKTMAGAMTWDKWQIIQEAGYEPQYVRNTLQWAVDGQPHHRNGLAAAPPTVFAEIGQLAGTAATDWSWAPLFADFDNDGFKDLFVTNGYLRDITDKDFLDYSANVSMFKSPGEANRDLLPKIRLLKGKKLPNRIFHNNGDLTFSPGNEDWGFTQPTCSNGGAYADLDNDGDLDLIVNNINEAASLYENSANNTNHNHYLSIRLEGLPGNTSGVGTKVTIIAGKQRQYLEQHLSRGFMSSVSGILHVGLGANTTIDTLVVRWGDGKSQILTDLMANQTLTIKASAAKDPPPQNNTVSNTLLQDVTARSGVDFTHHETAFNDFQYQPLLPHGFAQNGPPIAVGDLNGDALDDFYVGGAKGQSGRLFFQQPDGRFTWKDLPKELDTEDTASIIFDVNGDGYNDLYIVSGGCEWAEASLHYQDKLFVNDGRGNLQAALDALPSMPTPGACVSAADFDGDGDLDLFVGGSVLPMQYPLPDRSYLLQNDGGKFTDVTATFAPELQHPGIVTDAQWADVDNDSDPDLVLVGEWMPITIYANIQGKLIDQTAKYGLNQSSGWWNTLAIHDLDGDGDLDVVAGNLGLNAPYKVSEQTPLRLYAKDFDNNGTMDAIVTRTEGGKEKPVHQRDELRAQINGLSKKYPRYAPFAAATVQEIFGEKVLLNAYTKTCNNLQSSCFFQQQGRFLTKVLPIAAQIAPVKAILCADFNADHYPDILLTGNDNAASISTGKYDASNGILLLGDGHGGFSRQGAARSGFWVDGVGESLASIRLISGSNGVLSGENNGPLRLFHTPIANVL